MSSTPTLATGPLADVTLLSDGQTIYAAHSADEVFDVLQRGQGVFVIAVRPAQDELEGDLHDLYPERDVHLAAEGS